MLDRFRAGHVGATLLWDDEFEPILVSIVLMG